tara:strand:+ start:217 stop:357 length:141 start_codon:yes stop_codon:yes gene_type:complete
MTSGNQQRGRVIDERTRRELTNRQAKRKIIEEAEDFAKLITERLGL